MTRGFAICRALLKTGALILPTAAIAQPAEQPSVENAAQFLRENWSAPGNSVRICEGKASCSGIASAFASIRNEDGICKMIGTRPNGGTFSINFAAVTVENWGGGVFVQGVAVRGGYFDTAADNSIIITNGPAMNERTLRAAQVLVASCQERSLGF